MMLYVAVLFYVLTPGILLSIPPGGSNTVVALVHAGVFALVFGFTNSYISDMFNDSPKNNTPTPSR